MGFFCRRWLPCGKCYHLITLRLDTALIDDVGRTYVVGGVVQTRKPRQALPESLGCLFLVVAWPLAKLTFLAREALLLPISCSFGSISISLSCMLILQVSWFFNL